jgi:hypothetical protein
MVCGCYFRKVAGARAREPRRNKPRTAALISPGTTLAARRLTFLVAAYSGPIALTTRKTLRDSAQSRQCTEHDKNYLKFAADVFLDRLFEARPPESRPGLGRSPET